jgi:hypothetical protein
MKATERNFTYVACTGGKAAKNNSKKEEGRIVLTALLR